MSAKGLKDASAQRVIENIRTKTNEIIIMLSFGKDSIVVLDKVYGKFDRIVCVFMYFVKDLEHVERWVRWAKAQYKGIEIIQIPHFSLTYVKRSGLYCTPTPNQRLLSLSDICKAVRKKLGIEYVFLGMKKADSMNRRLMMMTYDEFYENNGMVYPLAEWTNKEVLSYMKQRNLPQPVLYGKAASNGIGFNLDCFMWMYNNFPRDLLKVLEAFPLSERMLFKEGISKEDVIKKING